MKKRKVFNVFCEVYGVNLCVVSGYSHAELEGFLKKKHKITLKDHYENTADGKAGGVMSFPKWPFHVLWLSDRYDTNGGQSKTDLVAKLSHEVLHHVLRVCASKGIPTYPEIDNLIMDEPAAYLMEFYVREILKKLWK